MAIVFFRKILFKAVQNSLATFIKHTGTVFRNCLQKSDKILKIKIRLNVYERALNLFRFII